MLHRRPALEIGYGSAKIHSISSGNSNPCRAVIQSRRSSAVRLRSVENLELDQSLAGRLLGYGTLVAGPLEIDHVPEPRNVYRLVERLAG